MSLLLDALKKAAQDKQKASDLDKQGIQSPAKGEADDMEAKKIIESKEQDNIELELDSNVEEQATELEIDQGDLDAAADTQTEFTTDPPLTLENIAAPARTVSDEALHLLIYKTNQEYRRSQKILWTSLLTGSLVLLVAGGYYYYDGMLQEVESLERKHAIAMRTVSDQPVIEQVAQTSSTEHGNKQTALNDVNNKNQAPPVVTTKPESTKRPVRQASQTAASNKNLADSAFSVQKNTKSDPISELLNQAWVAYNQQDYATASNAYLQVLEREPINRDAWMGEAAVAVKLGKHERARAAYMKLLELDPRDQIATAGLANLDNLQTNAMSESKLKFRLQQQPDAPHLNSALGNYYARQNKWREAQSSYFKAWQGDSSNADYAFNLAVSLDQIGKYREAERFYLICLELAKDQNVSFSAQSVNERLKRTAHRSIKEQE